MRVFYWSWSVVTKRENHLCEMLKCWEIRRMARVMLVCFLKINFKHETRSFHAFTFPLAVLSGLTRPIPLTSWPAAADISRPSGEAIYLDRVPIQYLLASKLTSSGVVVLLLAVLYTFEMKHTGFMSVLDSILFRSLPEVSKNDNNLFLLIKE